MVSTFYMMCTMYSIATVYTMDTSYTKYTINTILPESAGKRAQRASKAQTRYARLDVVSCMAILFDIDEAYNIHGGTFDLRSLRYKRDIRYMSDINDMYDSSACSSRASRASRSMIARFSAVL